MNKQMYFVNFTLIVEWVLSFEKFKAIMDKSKWLPEFWNRGWVPSELSSNYVSPYLLIWRKIRDCNESKLFFFREKSRKLLFALATIFSQLWIGLSSNWKELSISHEDSWATPSVSCFITQVPFAKIVSIITRVPFAKIVSIISQLFFNTGSRFARALHW